jgi:hypothetical protein
VRTVLISTASRSNTCGSTGRSRPARHSSNRSRSSSQSPNTKITKTPHVTTQRSPVSHLGRSRPSLQVFSIFPPSLILPERAPWRTSPIKSPPLGGSAQRRNYDCEHCFGKCRRWFMGRAPGQGGPRRCGAYRRGPFADVLGAGRPGPPARQRPAHAGRGQGRPGGVAGAEPPGFFGVAVRRRPAGRGHGPGKPSAGRG